jgi:hypothetical protein
MRAADSELNKTLAVGVRRGALFVVLWAFGLSTTLLLLGLWGRAVTADEATLTRSATAALSSEAVADRVHEWIGDGIAVATDLPVEEIQPALATIESSSELERAIDLLVEDAVAVIMAPEGSEQTIDVMGALRPLIPLLVGELEERDVEVSEDAVTGALAELDGVEIDTGQAARVPVAAAHARSVLTVGVVLALAALLASGLAAVALAEDRVAMVRSIGTRIALSGLSFAVLFRFGGWALDPDGGRSPLLSSGSIVLGSNQSVFLTVAAIGAVTALAAAAAWWWAAQRRLRTVTPSEVNDDEPTRELVGV